MADEAELARKKKLRSAQRAAVTRIIGQIQDLVSKSEIELSRLKLKGNALLEKKEIIKKLDSDILEATPEEELETEIERSDAVEEQIELAIILIDETMAAGNGADKSSVSGGSLEDPSTEPHVSEAIVSVSSPVSSASAGQPTSVLATPLWLTTPTSTTTSVSQPITSVVNTTVPLAAGTVTTPVFPSTRVSHVHHEGHVASPPELIPMPPLAPEFNPLPQLVELPPGHPATSVVPPITAYATTTPPSAKVKLPKLVLKKFNGDLTAWSTFWELFQNSVHFNSALSNIEKFSYLLSLLESSALEAVSGLSLTTANYVEAISILKKRFGNKHLIVSKHMEVLMSVENVGSDHNLKGLRRLFDTVESQVRGLRALGITADSYGGLLSSLLITKLPPEMRLIVSRSLNDDSWELGKMLSVFENELIARERANVSRKSASTTGGRSPPTAATFMAKSTPTCAFCGQGHASSGCTVVVSAEARKQSLRRSGRCFICLRRNHLSRNCRSTGRCSHCRGRHHASICLQHSANNDDSTPASTATDDSKATPVMCVDSKNQAMLQTATIVVHSGERDRPTHKTRMILDCGSQRTYVTSRIQQILSLPTSSVEAIEIKPFGTKEGKKQLCNVVDLKIVCQDGHLLSISALVVPCICDDVNVLSLRKIQDRYSHLTDLNLADVGDGLSSIEVLIGADQYWSVVTGRVRQGSEGPTAIETRVGWILSGPVENSAVLQSFTTSLLSSHSLRVDAVSDNKDLNENLKQFWELEAMGICSSHENSVHDKFVQEITFKNGRYEVSLPWRENSQELPVNFDVCQKRLHGLHQRLLQDPELLEAYDCVIQEQLKAGVIERVPNEVTILPERVHYLPHHPVVRQDKSTSRVRVVYDASCNRNGPSLNQCLYVGPNFGQSILGILLRFRVHKVALIGDIEKAFLMINIANRDKDVLRFLWLENPRTVNSDIVKFRFTRVVFGVSSSPFLL